jgi:deoxycytidylate deaminase
MEIEIVEQGDLNIETISLIKNKCAKQTTVAIIVSGDKVFIGTNSCKNPQKVCPRDEQGFKTGEGYHLCKEICNQGAHAEVDACQKAGEFANGAILMLFGHYYCCENCKNVMKQYGIKNVKIFKDY